MKGKIVKNTFDSLINALSRKNTVESKAHSRKKLLKTIPFFSSAATLHLLDGTGTTPLEVLNLFNSYNVDIGNTYMALYATGSFLVLTGNEEVPIQESIAQYGSEYCPYESYNVSNNDLKAKSIQMKINNLHNISYKLGDKSFFGKIIKKTATVSESLLFSMGSKSKKILDFIGKGELGFELLTHKNQNPRLVNELPIPEALIEVLNPHTLDLDNQYKIEERKLVFEIRERTMLKSKESVIERNVVLALVKAIDKIKAEDYSLKEINILQQLKKLKKLTSIGSLEKNKSITDLTNLLFPNETITIEEVKGIEIPYWDKEQNLGERSYNILNELNKKCFRNKIENIKNPMTYREIYRNNLIMSVQFKIRSDYESENIILNNKAPLIKEHFLNTHKNYYKDLNKFKIVKMEGLKIEDYPIFNFAKQKLEDMNVEKELNFNNLNNENLNNENLNNFLNRNNKNKQKRMKR